MISIIVCTMRPSFMDNIFDNYERQAIKKKQLIIILNRDDMDIKKWRTKARLYHNVSVYQVPEQYTLGKCMNYGIRKATYDLIAKFDDDDYYSPYYLNEAVYTLNRRNISIVGKSAAYIYFEASKALMIFRERNERMYERHIKGGTLVFRRALWDTVKFPEDKEAGCDVGFIRICTRLGYKVYSMQKYNYVCIRREDTNTHTQRKSTEEYMSQCKLVCWTDDYVPMITKEFNKQ